MSEQVYAYPFDPTGKKPSNLVQGEMHTVSPQTNIPPDYPNFFLVIPEVGPFFEDGFKVEHFSSNGTRELNLGTDFYFAYHFVSASRATGKRLYGGIALNNMALTGALRISYQTVGGPWAINLNIATRMLANVASNPRITTWESVIELPHAFPVIDHEWHLDDMVGMSEMVEAIEDLTSKIRTGGQASMLEHINARGNVHGLTARDINLDKVPNFPVATYKQIDDGDNESLVTPHLLDYRINKVLNGEDSSAITSRVLDKASITGVRWRRIASITKSVEQLKPFADANNYPSLTLLISNTSDTSANSTNVDIVNVKWRPGYVRGEHTVLLRNSNAEYFVRLNDDRPELWMRTEDSVGEATVIKLSNGDLYTIQTDTPLQLTRPLGLESTTVTKTYVDMAPYSTYSDVNDLGMAVVQGISDAILTINSP